MEALIKLQELISLWDKADFSSIGLYETYHSMKNASKIIDERIDEVSKMILEEMTNNKEEKKQFEFGSFTVGKRKTWKYSENVKKAEDTIKELKKSEEKDGIATFEEKPFLLCK